MTTSVQDVANQAESGSVFEPDHPAWAKLQAGLLKYILLLLSITSLISKFERHTLLDVWRKNGRIGN